MVTRKKIIVVLAMHRSGSSAITRALSTLGVDLGSALLPPVKGNNDKGFFEDAHIYGLNIEMLKAVGQDWDHVSPVTANSIDFLLNSNFLLRATELLRQKTQNSDIFGFKDPRTSKLLPFWKKVFELCDFETHYLLTLRNPLSVSHSLSHRDQFPPGKSHLLWIQHVLSGLMLTEADSRIVVDYDHLLDQPQRHLKMCADQFDLDLDQASLDTYQSEFLDQSLRHARFHLSDLDHDPACPSLAREMYAALLECSLGKRDVNHDEIKHVTIDWSRQAEAFKPLLSTVDTLSAKNNELKSEMETLKQSVKDQDLKSMTNAASNSQQIIDKLSQQSHDIQLLEAKLLQQISESGYASTLLEYKLFNSLDAIQNKVSEFNEHNDDGIRTLSQQMQDCTESIKGVVRSSASSLIRRGQKIERNINRINLEISKNRISLKSKEVRFIRDINKLEQNRKLLTKKTSKLKSRLDLAEQENKFLRLHLESLGSTLKEFSSSPSHRQPGDQEIVDRMYMKFQLIDHTFPSSTAIDMDNKDN